MRTGVKVLIISLGSLLVIGGSVIMGVGFLNSDYSTTERRIDLTDKDVKNFEFDLATSDVTFIASNDKKVVLTESKHVKVEDSFEGSTLKLTSSETRKWYERISFDWAKKKVDVYLPAGDFANLKLKNSTGNIKVPHEFTFESVNIELSTGDIEYDSNCSGEVKIKSSTGDQSLNNVAAKSISLDHSTGKVSLKNINVIENVVIDGSTGKNNLENVRCANLDVKSSTGKINLKDVVTTGNIKLKASTGDVDFEDMDCGADATCSIDIKTDTGDVEGSLLTGKIFDVDSDTGKRNVPASTPNTATCKVRTDTGDIKITVKA